MTPQLTSPKGTSPSSPRSEGTGQPDLAISSDTEVSAKSCALCQKLISCEAPSTFMPSVADEDYEENDDDGDSAFGGARSDMTDTASMTSSIMKYREENGRTYHAFGMQRNIQL